jgi:hypothetical protein
MLPAFELPGSRLPLPWLISRAFASLALSWLATVWQFGVSAFASQS